MIAPGAPSAIVFDACALATAVAVDTALGVPPAAVHPVVWALLAFAGACGLLAVAR